MSAAKHKADAAEEAVDKAASEAAEDEQVLEAEVIEDDAAGENEGAVEGDSADDALAKAEAEAAEMRDRYTRLQAEWDNFRKRTASERESERQRAAEKLVSELLPVIDDLDRAIEHADAGSGNLVDGVTAVRDKFLTILGKFHVEQIAADGQAFNAMQHQAVGTQEDASVPEETVIQVYQKGYCMGDRVLRPAMVITSTGGPARPAGEE